MTTLVTYAACVTGAFLIVAALLVIVGCDLRARERQVKAMRAVDHSTCRETEQGLRDQLDSESEVARYWFRKAEARYQSPGFVQRPDFAEHTSDALRVVEGGNVVRLPRQRGGA